MVRYTPTTEEIYRKYESGMNHLLLDIEYINNLTNTYENQSDDKLKRGFILLKRYKLKETIKRFFKFVKRNEQNISTNAGNEEQLKNYDATDNNKYIFENQNQTDYYTKIINESITMDKGARMEHARLKRAGKIKP